MLQSASLSEKRLKFFAVGFKQLLCQWCVYQLEKSGRPIWFTSLCQSRAFLWRIATSSAAVKNDVQFPADLSFAVLKLELRTRKCWCCAV